MARMDSQGQALDRDLLLAPLSDLQNQLLLLSEFHCKQLHDAVEKCRSIVMASAEQELRHARQTSVDSYAMNGSDGEALSVPLSFELQEKPEPSSVFEKLDLAATSQPTSPQADPYPASPSPLSSPRETEQVHFFESKKNTANGISPDSASTSRITSRSTSRIQHTETGAAAQQLKLAQERRNGLDTAVGIAVLLNAFVMVADLESVGYKTGAAIGLVDQGIWVDAPPIITVLEHLFVVIFIVELIYRVYSERLSYFKELMNVFDTCLVLIACVDLYILTPMVATSFNNTAALRLLRTIKLVRAVRIVRALRLFRGLRLLVQACSSFLPSLCWSMALLGIFMMMGALLMGNLLQEFILDDSSDFEIREWTWMHYGTAYRAIYTMYEMTFAGNWPVYARPVLENAGHGYVIFYFVYITFVVFAVIRVISAIFLRETLEAANNDNEILVQERLRKKATYVKKLESIFRACDESGDGVLTEDELNELLQDVRVQVYMESLEVDVHETTALFRLLQNGDGEITCDDFIDGILRCKGPARAIDQILLSTDVKMLADLVEKLAVSLAEAEVIAPTARRHRLGKKGGSRLQDELTLLPSVGMTLSGRYVM